jgi:hypothetical protein
MCIPRHFNAFPWQDFFHTSLEVAMTCGRVEYVLQCCVVALESSNSHNQNLRVDENAPILGAYFFCGRAVACSWKRSHTWLPFIEIYWN